MLNNTNTIHSHLLNDCRSLIRSMSDTSIQHTYRELNTVADKLAHFGMEMMGRNITVLHNPLTNLMEDLLADKWGRHRNRHKSTTTITQPNSEHPFCKTFDVPSTSSNITHPFCNRVVDEHGTDHLHAHTHSSTLPTFCNTASKQKLHVLDR